MAQNGQGALKDIDQIMAEAAPNQREGPPPAPPETALATTPDRQARAPIVFTSEAPPPIDFDQALRLSKAMLAAQLAPSSWTTNCKTYEEALAAVALCLCFGREQGLSMTETVGSVYIVRNRPTLWGDIIGAKVMASGLLEDSGEDWTGEGATRSVTVWAKRKGIASIRKVTFGYAEAKQGGLLGKDTYKAWPDDMFSRRAWGRLYYRLFPDVLKGMAITEIEQDGVNEAAAARADEAVARIESLPEPTRPGPVATPQLPAVKQRHPSTEVEAAHEVAGKKAAKPKAEPALIDGIG